MSLLLRHLILTRELLAWDSFDSVSECLSIWSETPNVLFQGQFLPIALDSILDGLDLRILIEIILPLLLLILLSEYVVDLHITVSVIIHATFHTFHNEVFDTLPLNILSP